MEIRQDIWKAGRIVTVALCVSFAHGQSTDTGRGPFSDGETLQYKVKWGFIRLGSVTIHQVRTSDSGTYRVRMVVRSAAGIPFLNVHFVNEARLQRDNPHVDFVRVSSGEDSTEYSTIVYEESSGLVVFSDTLDGKQTRTDTIRWQGPLYDALSLFMTARAGRSRAGRFSLPTVNNYTIEQTDLELSGETEMLEVPALGREYPCRFIRGVAHWTGSSFAGMTGEFIGWLSADSAAIPVRAEVRIFLGSIVLELESFRRPNWPVDSVVYHVVREAVAPGGGK